MADKTEKKRKRHADKTDRPSKKVALDVPADVVKLTCLDDDDALGPVMAATPGLSPPADIALKPYKKRLIDTRLLPPGYKAKKNPYELLLQSSDHPMLDFAARQERDGTADSLLKHYVGVFDPATGELKVMEAHRLVLRSTLRSETEEMQLQREGAAETEAQSESNFALRQKLGASFGTKKAKKALASLTENAIAPSAPRAVSPGGTQASVTADSGTAGVLESMANTASDMPTLGEQQAAVDENKPRPKANLEATTPAEVYTPESLIGSDSMRIIEVKSWLEAVEKKEDVKTSSRFVANRLQAIASQKSMKKLKVLKYILLLIEFLAALKPGRHGMKKLPQRSDLETKTQTSGALLDGVRRKFAGGNDMNKWQIDNLMTHIAALSLIIDNYEVDTFDLREDLRLENKQIAQYFSEIGCKVTPPTEKERERNKFTKAEAVNHRTARLKIPLEFPKQRIIRRR